MEFEPRIKKAKERLAALEEQVQQAAGEAALKTQLQLVIGKLKDFKARVHLGLGASDWVTRRELVRSLVKRVEIDNEQINVVFRVSSIAFTPGPENGVPQDCLWSLDM